MIRDGMMVRWIPLALLTAAIATACASNDPAAPGGMLDPSAMDPTIPGAATDDGDMTSTGDTSGGDTSTPVDPGTDATPSTPDTEPDNEPGNTEPGTDEQPDGPMTDTPADDDPTGAAGSGGTPEPGETLCRSAQSADEDGPFTPTHIESAGPTGGSWVFYPEDLGADGMTHPVFVWGPGAGTGPAQYTDHLNRLASHGFVVISQPSSGSGTTETAALDWILAENEMSGSTFHQKLDPERVGMGGHSLGSLTTMAMADDPRLSLYVLVCGGCMSSGGGCGAADIHGPTVILGGDGDIGTPNYESDYDEISAPVVFLTKSSTGHIDCARNNLSPWVAFMRWQFCNEEQWEPEFFDGGEYCQSPWECKSKNF